MSNAMGGPVSEALEASLRRRVQQQGVVLWLDMSVSTPPPRHTATRRREGCGGSLSDIRF